MYMEILLYQSTKSLNQLTNGFLAIIVGLAILRCIFTIYGAFDDPDMTFKQALQRSKKTIIRSVLVICASSVVSWVNSFYK